MDNIRTDLQEVGCGYMDWIERVQDRDKLEASYIHEAVLPCKIEFNHLSVNFVSPWSPKFAVVAARSINFERKC